MTRRRLARDLVWPVTRAQVRAALGDRVDQVVVTFADESKQPAAAPVSAKWRTQEMEDRGPAGLDYIPWLKCGVSVWLRPIARDDLEVLRPLVESEVLPDLARWVGEALDAGEGWKLSQHEREWEVTTAGVRVRDHDGTH